MSATLMWRPILSGKYLPDDVKWVLQKRYVECWPVKMGRSDTAYLTGLVDAGVKGAQEILDLIKKHDEIELFLSY